jgi:hypothetical protein
MFLEANNVVVDGGALGSCRQAMDVIGQNALLRPCF